MELQMTVPVDTMTKLELVTSIIARLSAGQGHGLYHRGGHCSWQ